MKIDVHFEPAAPLPDLTGSTVVVIDVLRATSSMVEALVNGARGVYPVASTEEAIKLAASSRGRAGGVASNKIGGSFGVRGRPARGRPEDGKQRKSLNTQLCFWISRHTGF